MLGFALPFVFVVVAGAVTVFRIFLGLPFPPPLAIIGALSAVGALAFGVFFSYLRLRSVANLDYVDPTQFKNVSIYLHVFETIFIVLWLNWITGMITVPGMIAGPIFLVALIAIVTLRVRRARMIRRRQLWEK